MYFSDDMRELVLLFKKHGVDFAICSGFAVAHYGFVRMTMDFDLLINPSPENAKRIMAALEEFGFGQVGVCCLPLNTENLTLQSTIANFETAN
ncbi:MAG: hypothetical protein HQ517_13425 [SAR324 cluster bacterium]|nr:hypothetical protein [SAR324 cluster bacterium]